MTFEYRKNNSAVIDKERNIILYYVGTWYGKNNEPRGGARFELQFPQGTLYAHLFLNEHSPTPDKMILNWDPNVIFCTESLRGKEKEVLIIFAEALLAFPYYKYGWDSTIMENTSSDINGWEQRIQFKESIHSRVHPMYVYTPTN